MPRPTDYTRERPIPTNVGLYDEDRAALQAILTAHPKLSGVAEAVRVALRAYAATLPESGARRGKLA